MSTGNWSPVFIRISEIMFFVAGTLYYISSTINPILYNVMSRRYRQAFRRTVCGCCDADGTPTRTGTITSYAPITQPGKNGAQMNMNEMNCGNGNMPTVVAEEFV
ncbi:PREDICTED: neurotensin receptor type 1-like [Priapulus caudatus]|uniref:Neurotensin receptor type 1-like n=1 Tax=Priapulus caudatus TaxID=37621 RepID=A0ABM1ER06_PRICU|nr:PREDICTED: neurotensin receptor type 1-like [Priapulus caudatus]